MSECRRDVGLADAATVVGDGITDDIEALSEAVLLEPPPAPMLDVARIHELQCCDLLL